MPPPDESTSLVPETRPLNWRQKCRKFWCFVYFLPLLADVVLSILLDYNTFKYYNKVNVNVSALPTEEGLDLKKELEDNLKEAIAVVVIDASICWIFLIIVARSPRFVGCFTILKNLIGLPRFWNLVSLLVLYIIGVVAVMKVNSAIEIVFVIEPVTELLNVFTKVALVGVLNHVRLQDVARLRFNYLFLKGILAVTCFFQFCTLIGAMGKVYFTFLRPIATGSSGDSVLTLFLLPFFTRTTELIWTKILQDNKCIIGKYENYSFTRQNLRISNAIETIIWKKSWILAA